MGTLKGVYGYYHGRPGGGATITGVLGQIVSDGTGGGLSGSWTMSVNGTISNGSFDGSYNIAANCTGTLAFATDDTSNARFDIVLDDTHKGFQIQADPGFAQPGFGLAQGLAACGLTGVRQTFATNFQGKLFPGLEIEAIAGQLKWDGLGNITSGIETFSVGGAITTSAVSGTYTEENNCQGTAQTISGLARGTSAR